MPPPSGPERGIGRVIRDGRPVGLAFCVGDRALLTCAHVVNTALGRRDREAAPPPEHARILVEFPFGGGPDDEPVRYATVAMWGPSAGSFDRHDLAGLVLRDDRPDGAGPLHLADLVGPGGTVVQLWGPGRSPTGAHVEAVLHGAVDHGRYQIDQRATGTFKAGLGYSGGPVWLQADHQVVGVLSAAATDDSDGDAYLIGVEVAVALWPEVLYRPPPCPYRGLDAFGPDDAAFFFGRDDVVSTLVEHAERLPVVTVMGPSGSGKSSVLAAGLVAALRERSPLAYVAVRPGRGVLTELATALATRASTTDVVPPAELDAWERRLLDQGIGAALETLRRSVGVDRAVLVLDQFEQVVGPDHPADQRDACLRLLADFALTPVDLGHLVALSLRHDFLGQLIAGNRDFGPYLQRTAVMLYPPSEAELRAAIVEPALRADPSRPVTVEPALVAQILEDFAGQAGELPLVQFALTRLWLRQTRPVLASAGYAELGGARRALTAYADDCVDRLTEPGQQAARRIFCRLGLTDGFAVGRRVLKPELPPGDWAVAEQLAGADARLLVVGWDSGAGSEYVEIAHEILLRAWPRLRDWLAADREFLTWLRTTDGAHQTWQEHGQDGRLLLPEPLLERAERMVAERGPEVEHLRAYVVESRQALYRDDLTGLPNRRGLLHALDELMRQRKPDQLVAVLEVDISELRMVNRSFGQPVGDELIGAVGQRLRALAPVAARVGRAGGDEFGVLVRVPDPAAALALAKQLREGLRGRFQLTSHALDLEVDTSVGLAVHPDHGTDPDALLQCANTATEAAKWGGGGVKLFEVSHAESTAGRLQRVSELREALARDDGFEVRYQPVVNLSDGELVAVECLLRMKNASGRHVSPAEFIPLAEETGLIGQLDDFVLDTALRDAARWPYPKSPLHLSINFSARSVTDPQLVDRVAAALSKHGIPPERLTLELTESAWLGPDVGVLSALHHRGVRLAVDDFGTGYSSLSYLRRLPLHEIKIDRSFITGLDSDPHDEAIVRTILDLAKALDLVTTATGIETRQARDALAGMGYDRGQGYLFARPLTFDELVRQY